MLSSEGRLGARPFVLAAAAIYLLGLLSQSLLTIPVTVSGTAPYVLAQAALCWAWYAIHVRRLRDTGRGVAAAAAIALLYALSVVLLVLLFVALTAAAGGGTPDRAMLYPFAVVYLFAALSASPMSGAELWPAGLAAMIAAPLVVAVGFSAWLATRPSVA